MPNIDYLSKESLTEAGITEGELTAIQEDFKKKIPSYEQVAQAITNVLLKTSGVHSVRYRIKDSFHLFEKVARKRYQDRARIITPNNYEQEITDLAGVRILHLFKKDWQRIHRFITKTWTLHENPTAYYREGDSAEVLNMFTKQDCVIKQHPHNYRSVHYIVETSLTKAKLLVEIQVRTLFEEGWSEVDHKVRYPNFSDDPLTNSLLSLLNRLAGSADEMSSFVQELHQHLITSKRDISRLKQQHEEKVAQMQIIIDNLSISSQEKSKLEGAAKSLGVSFSDTISITHGKKLSGNVYNDIMRILDNDSINYFETFPPLVLPTSNDDSKVDVDDEDEQPVSTE